MARDMNVVRTRLYFRPDQVEACDSLARRHTATRSEIFRIAVDQGLPLVVDELRRKRRERRVRAEEARSASGPAAAPGHAGDPVEELRSYAAALGNLDPDRSVDELRLLLSTQAKMLRIPAEEVDDVVDEIVSSAWPASVGGHRVDPREPPQ